VNVGIEIAPPKVTQAWLTRASATSLAIRPPFAEFSSLLSGLLTPSADIPLETNAATENTGTLLSGRSGSAKNAPAKQSNAKEIAKESTASRGPGNQPVATLHSFPPLTTSGPGISKPVAEPTIPGLTGGPLPPVPAGVAAAPTPTRLSTPALSTVWANSSLVAQPFPSPQYAARLSSAPTSGVTQSGSNVRSTPQRDLAFALQLAWESPAVAEQTATHSAADRSSLPQNTVSSLSTVWSLSKVAPSASGGPVGSAQIAPNDSSFQTEKPESRSAALASETTEGAGSAYAPGSERRTLSPGRTITFGSPSAAGSFTKVLSVATATDFLSSPPPAARASETESQPAAPAPATTDVEPRDSGWGGDAFPSAMELPSDRSSLFNSQNTWSDTNPSPLEPLTSSSSAIASSDATVVGPASTKGYAAIDAKNAEKNSAQNSAKNSAENSDDTSDSNAGNASTPKSSRVPFPQKVSPQSAGHEPPGASANGLALGRFQYGTGSSAMPAKTIAQPSQPSDVSGKQVSETAENTRAATSQTIREVSLRLGLPTSSPVDVQLAERAGKLQVAVRTSDPDLAKSLQTNLGELVGRLEEKGFKTDVWTPIAAPHASLAVREPGTSSGGQSSSDQSGTPGGQPESGGGQQQQEQRQPERWTAELEETLSISTTSEETSD